MEKRDEKIWINDIKTLRIIKIFVVFFITYITIFLLNKCNIIGFGIIPSPSMEPTLKTQSVVVEMGFKKDDVIKRGTICYFKRDGLKDMEDNTNSYLAKRVIGLPGETVLIRGGYVYINGEKLDESIYTEMGTTYISGDFSQEWILGEDEYFLMGDNRKNSKDSRYFGVVTRNNILGKIVFILFPFSDIGSL